jgi:hypothetical protein
MQNLGAQHWLYAWWCVLSFFLACLATVVVVRGQHIDPPRSVDLEVAYAQACSRMESNCDGVVTVTMEGHAETGYGQLLDRAEKATFLLVAVHYGKEQALDLALMTRPWWHLLPDGAVINGSHTVVLQQMPPRDRLTVQKIADYNFPSAGDCSSRTMMLSLHDGDTWGNRYINLRSEIDQVLLHNSILSIFVTSRNSPHDKVYFSGENYCVADTNKWDCLFLPTTNCSLPTEFRNCHDDRQCMPEAWGSGIYTSASEAGRLLRPVGGESVYSNVSNPSNKDIRLFAGLSLGSRQFTLMKSSALPNEITATSLVSQRKESEITVSTIWYNAVLTRFKVQFQAKIQNLMHSFRTSHPFFHRDTQCIALHIRMDDRNKPGLDLEEWCNRCALFRDGVSSGSGGYRRRSGFNFSCSEYDEGTWCDYGCNTDLPYGSASLEHYINASYLLNPSINHLFIMTDDMNWLHSQRVAYNEKYHAGTDAAGSHRPVLHVFPTRPNHRSSNLAAAEDFWASVALAQQVSLVMLSVFTGYLASVLMAMLCLVNSLV